MASFGSSKKGLLRAIRSELCLIGDEVEVGRMSDINRESGRCLDGGSVPSDILI